MLQKSVLTLTSTVDLSINKQKKYYNKTKNKMRRGKQVTGDTDETDIVSTNMSVQQLPDYTTHQSPMESKELLHFLSTPDCLAVSQQCWYQKNDHTLSTMQI